VGEKLGNQAKNVHYADKEGGDMDEPSKRKEREYRNVLGPTNRLLKLSEELARKKKILFPLQPKKKNK